VGECIVDVAIAVVVAVSACSATPTALETATATATIKELGSQIIEEDAEFETPLPHNPWRHSSHGKTGSLDAGFVAGQRMV